MRIKVFIGILFSLTVFAADLWAYEPYNRSKPDQLPLYSTEQSTFIFRVDYDGNLLPGRSGKSTVGESTNSYKHGFFENLDVSSGIQNVVETFIDIPTASSAAMVPALGLTISTRTLVVNGTNYVARDLTQMTVPRNVTIYTTFTQIDTISTVTLSGMATFYGINAMGIPASESIRISTALNYGYVAWASISSVTIQITSVTAGALDQANTFIFIGSSVSIGLSNVVTSTGDIYKLVEAGADNVVDANTPVSLTYETIQFENAPNGSRDYTIHYVNRQTRR